MPGCSAFGCSNSSAKGYAMKKFPTDPIRRKQWAVIADRGNWKPTKHTVLCEMPQVCCVVDCKHKAVMCRLKKYPADPIRANEWTKHLKRTSSWTPCCWSRVCECHFDERQFEQNRQDGLKKLRPDAVPTIFHPASLDDPRNAKQFLKKERVNPANDIISENIIRDAFEQEHNYVAFFTKRPGEDSNDVENSERKSDHEQSATEYPSKPNFQPVWAIKCDEDLMKKEFSLLGVNSNKRVEAESRESINNGDSDQLATMQRENYRLNQEIKQLKDQLDKTQKKYNKLFNPDQVEYFAKKHMQKWSRETIKAALRIRHRCGIKGYNYLLQLGWPYPSYSTIVKQCSRKAVLCGVNSNITELLDPKTPTSAI